MVAPALELSGWSGNRGFNTHLRYELDGEPVDLYVRKAAPDLYRVTVGDDEHEVAWLSDGEEGAARIAVDGIQQNLAWCFPERGQVALQLGGRAALFSNLLALSAAELAGAGSGNVSAPMHGNLMKLMVALGDRVAVGDSLAVMEAMKMEHKLLAEVAGEVTAIHGKPGEQIAAGTVLLEITAEPAEASPRV